MSSSRSKTLLAKRHRLSLKSKLQEIKTFYDDALEMFKKRLDSLTNQVVQEACDTLDAPDEFCLSKAPKLFQQMESCISALVETFLLFDLNEDESSSDGKGSACFENEKNTSVISRRLDFNSSSEKVTDTSAKELRRLSAADSGDEIGKAAASWQEMCSKELSGKERAKSACAENSDCTLPLCSKGSPTVAEPLPSCCVIEKVEPEREHTASSSVKAPDSENTLTYVISSTADEKYLEVVVSDVRSPSRFSVQLDEWLEAIDNLQCDINDFYSGMGSDRLRLSRMPSVGKVYVALFSMDARWYRVKVCKVLQNSRCEVLYIDYGNSSVLHASSLRKPKRKFLELPPLSVCCALDGIVPSARASEWSDSSCRWFNEFVLSKKFSAKFHSQSRLRDKGGSPVVVTSLFSTSKSQSGNMLWSVAQTMVCLNFAAVRTDKAAAVAARQDCVEDQGEERSKISDKRVSRSAFTSPRPRSAPVMQQRSIPSGAERMIQHIVRDGRFSAGTPCTTLHGGNEVTVDRRPMMTRLESVSNEAHQGSQAKRDEWDDWNPMKEEFASSRNNYATNVDSCCVAVEGVDCDDWKACKFFQHGRCWKGENCSFAHLRRPETLYEYKVIPYQALSSIDVKPGHRAVIKCTCNTPSLVPGQFYGQVLATGPNCGSIDVAQSVPPELARLTDDMKSFYTAHRRRLTTITNICIGEMYVVVHEATFCRATTIHILGGRDERVKVFLVDYGETFWTESSRLLPFFPGFMHVPVQAVLFVNQSTEVPEQSRVYCAEVGEKVAEDAPQPVSILMEL